MESYLIIDENSNDPSSKELMITLNENDHRNKSIMDPPIVTKTTCTLVALCIVEVTQSIPLPLPIPTVPPKQYTILERTPLRAHPQVRSTDNRPKPLLYQILRVRNSKSKSNIKQHGVMELATCLQPYVIMKDLDSLHPHITMRQLMAITPQCRTKLGLAMIRKRSKVVKVNDITLSQDIGALPIDVTMDGVLIVAF